MEAQRNSATEAQSKAATEAPRHRENEFSVSPCLCGLSLCPLCLSG
jgi:hypothetical protein